MINWRCSNTHGRTGGGCQKREAPAKSEILNRSTSRHLQYYPVVRREANKYSNGEQRWR